MTKHISYRPEIDGLRAVAVLAVVLYHAKISFLGRDWFQGGFIGVDIFFVISGYLISKIIFTELERSDSFSFKRFYERRARRILPILFVVMLVSFPFAWLYLLPSDFIDYSKSILSSLSFSSNFFFYFNTTEYGTDSALLKPFLHTWSLSVEEQFYLLCPVVFLIAYKWFRNYLLSFCVIGLLLSLQFSEMMALRDSDLNFYLLPSRAWELLTGTLVALIERKYGRANDSLTSKLAPSIGLLLIVYSIVSFNSSTPHPGYVTVVPIIGIALIIFYAHANEVVGRVFSSKALVSIGLISYSLYLWHFPVFAFARITDGAPTVLDKLGWICLSLALSIVSYHYIEKPFRNKQSTSDKFALRLAAGSLCLLLALNALVINHSGFRSRLAPIFTNPAFSEKPWEDLQQDGKMCYERRSNLCTFKNNANDKTITLLGDSHLGAIQKDLVNRLSDSYNINISTLSGCWPVADFDRFFEDGRKDEACSAGVQSRRIAFAEKNENSIIIIGARLPLNMHSYFFDNKEGGIEGGFYRKFVNVDLSLAEGVQNTIRSFLDQGHSVIAIYPTPPVGWNVPKKLYAEAPKEFWKLKSHLINKPITTSYAIYKERAHSSFEALDGVQHENLYRVYPHTLFCDKQIAGRCVTHDSEHLYYSDDDHPSYRGAQMINDLIIDRVKAIELKEQNKNQ